MSYQDIDPKIAADLFEVKKNQLKMLEKRGYNIDPEKGILNLSLRQFLDIYVPHARKQNKSFRSVLTNYYTNDAGRRILVFYADSSPKKTQLGVEEVGHGIESMNKYKLKDAIIITPKPLSSSAVKHINELVAYNIQIFLEQEMGHDPTEHFMVPLHIPLTTEKQRKYLQDNNINIDQMPLIKTSDRIIRYYGLRGGRIVKIIRTNLYEGMVRESTTYKAVIED